MQLNEFETIEDLNINGLKIIQSKKLYRFTTDAVLLANFVGDIRNKSVVDLGTGSGIIAILLAGKKHAGRVVGVEIQPQLAEMATRSVILNNLTDKISIINCAMQGISKKIGNEFDCVVCNPPYRKVGSGDRQSADSLAICRHEIAVTLEEVAETASSLLNAKGSFFLVHQSNRLAEICCLMKKYSIEPKEILPVCPKADMSPNLVLFKGKKFGAVDCILHKPLVLMNDDNTLTHEAKKWYGEQG